MSEGESLVEAQGVGKRFKLYSNPNKRLIEWLSFGSAVQHESFWALQDVSLAVSRGQCLGIIGNNGSGKSSLLRILSGSLSPSTGKVSVRGRTLALIELGTGFNRQLTGRQNIPFVGQMLGLDVSYIQERIETIIEFAELGDFIDQPTKFYSSGMFARLGFSMFAFLNPDVLMIDEVLAVGDAAFKRKCLELLEQQIACGSCAVIYVSHSLESVTRLASRVCWLERGKVQLIGDPISVVNAFVKRGLGEDDVRRRAPREGQHTPAFHTVVCDKCNGKGRIQVDAKAKDTTMPTGGFLLSRPISEGDDQIQLTEIWIESPAGKVLEVGPPQRALVVCFALSVRQIPDDLRLELKLIDEDGKTLGVCNVPESVIAGLTAEPGDCCIVRCPMRGGVSPGVYRIQVSFRSQDGDRVDLLDQQHMCELPVIGAARNAALFDLFRPPLASRLIKSRT